MPCTTSSLRAETKEEKVLYVFDFDHTIVENDSELEIVVDHPLPHSVKSVLNGAGPGPGRNWNEYMNAVFKYLLSQDITFNEMLEKIMNMQPTNGIIEVLRHISIQPGANLLIASDSNDKFIKAFLSKYGINSTKIISNKLWEHSFELIPYEKQTSCPICPINLCKGAALTKYIEEDGPFANVIYVGDGKNDICPVSKLTPSDFVFARKNYQLEKIIKAGFYKNVKFQLQANIRFWDNGTDIQNVLFC